MKTANESFAVFAAACRENTGKHLLDSGSAYGRHWQRPAIAPDVPGVTVDTYGSESGRIDVTATIETAHYLAARFDPDADVAARFSEWQDGRDGDWFSLAEEFCRDELGLFRHARDNTYNHDSDLSQCVVWEVWTDNEHESDWIYPKGEALTVIFVHTGCDVRGGYGGPIFCRPSGDYPMPVDLCAGYYAAEGVDADGNELTDDQLRQIDERWQPGYSSYPAGQVRDDIASLPDGDARDAQSFRAVLKTGEAVKIFPVMPYA